jgi:stress-induced morphogen
MNNAKNSPPRRLQGQIQEILREAFHPSRLEVINESDQHAVPAGSETHFKVLIVAEVFGPWTRLERTRAVMSRLENLMKSGVHALSLRALSPEEAARGLADGFVSPPCAGARSSGSGD